MSPLEIALIILVFIWSLIFVIFGTVLIIIFLRIKHSLEKLNKILDTTGDVASGVKAMAAGAASIFGKSRVSSIKKLVAKTVGRKK